MDTTHTMKSPLPIMKQRWLWVLLAVAVAAGVVIALLGLRAHQPSGGNSLDNFQAQPYNSAKPLFRPHLKPQDLISPGQVKSVYHLTSLGTGSGTIAIIDAYDDPNIESDLGVFDRQYGLSTCTTANGCFEKHKMSWLTFSSSSWAVEASLDVEWAHAIAPGAKILLVEARSASGSDLINAINYARARSDVVAISMSWGGNEFASESIYEANFTSQYGATFFAASGDNGHGTSWPAVSANVIGVGGTTVNLNPDGSLGSEVAWSGSGGGISTYINEPARQSTFGVPQSGNHRATPDVSYDADPNTGFPVYDSVRLNGYAGWYQVGGTSAGVPQWAAIRALSNHTLTADKLYTDVKQPNQTTTRDITSGTNGNCGVLCAAGPGYDYVTGLGSPLVTSF